MWKAFDEHKLTIGMDVIIKPQRLITMASLYTPRWCAGARGKVVRINKYSVTVDIMDGGKNVYVDKDDIGDYERGVKE